MPPTFLIPSLVWYGLDPSLSGVGPAPGDTGLDAGWGGLMTLDEDAAQVLRTLEPALLLLNLAGYQVPEVAIGLPAETKETPQAELVAIDLHTMRFARGTTRPWTPLGGTEASAQVALWIEPRYPAAPPLEASGPTLSLATLGSELAVQSIDLAFAPSGSGWLRLSWPASALSEWPAELTTRVDLLAAALAAELARQGAAGAAGLDNGQAALCGLLGLFDSRTWRVPAPSDPPFDRITPAVTQFGEHLSEILARGPSPSEALHTFFDGEIAQPPVGPPNVPSRWAVAATDDEAERNLDDLVIFGDELVAQSFEASVDGLETVLFAESANRTFEDRTVTQLLLSAQELGVLDFLTTIGEQVAVAFPSVRYGGYDLRRHDDDATRRYGGTNRLEDAVPQIGYVAQLRRDLAELGFGPLFRRDPAEGPVQTFDLFLEWAVREFQLYSRMPKLAHQLEGGPFQFYGDGLEQVPNPASYGGPVSGVVNAETRLLIGTWLDGRLRCPVVVEAREKVDGVYSKKYAFPAGFAFPPNTGGAEWRTTDNLWRADQVPVPESDRAGATSVRMHARDLTGHWTLSADSVAAGRDLNQLVIGAWTTSDFGPGPWSNAPVHVWAESEVKPETLVGRPFGALSENERSTFRVVRTVSEVEDLGYFDCFNAYDPGFISAGPFHWTLGLQDGKGGTAPAELPPYFAYLESLGGDAWAAFEQVFGSCGCGATPAWPAGTWGEGSPLFDPDERKYTGWITLQNESGRAVPAPTAGNETAEWFRQWHWFFRFAMSCRTVAEFRKRMWDYTRMRLRDLLLTPWEPMIVLPGPGPARATIGDLFTSERAVATLLRWHVNAPPNLLPLDPAKRRRRDPVSRLTAAFDAAGAGAWGDPTGWTDANEEALGDALFALRLQPPVDKNVWLQKSLTNVHNWPTWMARNTYKWHLFDADVLPAPSFAGLVNAQTAVGVAKAIAFTVDWRGAAATTLSARSDNHAVVADAGVAIAGAAPNYTITLTPVGGASGRAQITAVADNRDGRTEATFTLTVGAPGGKPAAPSSSSGLSTRRGSFRLDEAGIV